MKNWNTKNVDGTSSKRFVMVRPLMTLIIVSVQIQIEVENARMHYTMLTSVLSRCFTVHGSQSRGECVTVAGE